MLGRGTKSQCKFNNLLVVLDVSLKLFRCSYILIFLPIIYFSNHIAIGQNEEHSLPTFEEFLKASTCSKSLLSPANETYDGDVPDRIYENSSLGFRIQYPSDWQLEEQFCTAEHQEFVQDSATVNIQSTPSSKESGSVFITITYDQSVPLNDHVISLTKMSTMMPDLKISDPQPINFKGIPAYHLIITRGGYSFNEIIMDVNGYRYNINSPMADFVSSSAIQKVIDSFSVP